MASGINWMFTATYQQGKRNLQAKMSIHWADYAPDDVRLTIRDLELYNPSAWPGTDEYNTQYLKENEWVHAINYLIAENVEFWQDCEKWGKPVIDPDNINELHSIMAEMAKGERIDSQRVGRLYAKVSRSAVVA